jgi:hypothetical protein
LTKDWKNNIALNGIWSTDLVIYSPMLYQLSCRWRLEKLWNLAIYYMSLQYHNKSKSQLTSPTPAQLPAVALSAGHIVYDGPNMPSRAPPPPCCCCSSVAVCQTATAGQLCLKADLFTCNRHRRGHLVASTAPALLLARRVPRSAGEQVANTVVRVSFARTVAAATWPKTWILFSLI